MVGDAAGMVASELVLGKHSGRAGFRNSISVDQFAATVMSLYVVGPGAVAGPGGEQRVPVQRRPMRQSLSPSHSTWQRPRMHTSAPCCGRRRPRHVGQ